MFPKNYPRKEDGASKKKESPATTTKLQPLMYQPSIYTYTCRGAYYVSTDQEQNNREGNCRGFRSRVELLSDMEANTRKGALEDFTYWSAGGEDGGDNYDIEDSSGEQQLDPQTKSVIVSPALIYKDTDLPSSSPSNTTSSDTIEKALDSSGDLSANSLLPEEELIQRQDWSCYGSTQVDYLLLRNATTGKEKIAAVAPRNNGLTIRHIDADPGNHVTCIGLGRLSVVMDSVQVSDDDKKIDSKTDQHLENKQQKAASDKETISPEEVPTKPDTLAYAKESADRAFQFSTKVAEHMKENASWMYHNLQDDFPSRTVASGQRIVHQIPVTVNRTASFMKKLVGRMVFDDDDDDDDDDDERGKRK
jgi:hypothetical protein